jgi:hypothetical protein
MKAFKSLLVMSLMLISYTYTAAQLDLPRISPKASVSQTIGLTNVTVNYSRPGVKGRSIWGTLVPYDKVWRTGANEATTVTFSDEVKLEGQKIPAGTYSLHTIPSKSEWTIIFNKDAGGGMYKYDATKDAIRLKVQPVAAEHEEWLSFKFPNVSQTKGQMVLHWEKLRVPVNIETDVVPRVMASAKTAIAAAKADDWRTPYRAAEFSLENSVNLEEALQWVERSIKAKETYYNLSLKAKFLANAGNLKEAIAYAEKALQVAKTSSDQEDTTETDKLLAEWNSKAGMPKG